MDGPAVHIGEPVVRVQCAGYFLDQLVRSQKRSIRHVVLASKFRFSGFSALDIAK
jgi:hypothetical protein